jgi:hypothetical protein
VVLGIVLYELIALESPFQATSLPALVFKICSSEPIYTKLESKFSPALLALTKSQLFKNPEKRPSIHQIVKTDFIKSHMSRLLSYTIKVGNGGAVEVLNNNNNLNINNNNEANKNNAKEAASGFPRNISTDLLDEKKRLKEQQEAKEKILKQQQQQQQLEQQSKQREEEKLKLKKFQQDMLQNKNINNQQQQQLRNYNNNNNNDNNDDVASVASAVTKINEYVNYNNNNRNNNPNKWYGEAPKVNPNQPHRQQQQFFRKNRNFSIKQ